MSRSLLATSLLFLLIPLAGWSQSTRFYPNSFSTESTIRGHGDFNSDGREDFVVYGYGSGGVCCLALIASNGDGSYTQTFSVPVIGWGPNGGSIVVGDFNGDGNLDIAVTAGNSLQVFLGDGTGRFGNAIITTLPSGTAPLDMVPADLNRDGKTDVLFSTPGYVHAFLSNGDGTFRAGPTTFDSVPSDHLLVGDFDGDGNTDLVAYSINPSSGTVQLTVMYGSGGGNFPGPRYDYGLPTASTVIAADLNGDGRSDLIAANEIDTSSGRMPQRSLSVLYGTSGHGLTSSSISLTRECAGPQVAVADFTGTGRADIAVPEVECGVPLNPNSQTSWNIKPNLGSGSFGADQFVFVTNLESGVDTVAVRLNADTEPDIAFTGNGGGWVLLNTSTGGNFPPCAAPVTARGINLCAPAAGSTVASPVRFAASASGASPMRDIQVWVDGTKRAEQLYGFSHYTFLDKNISLASGSHSVTVIAAGWDEQIQKKSFTLNVAPCAAPSTNGVNICAPANGAVLPSPVQVIATARVSGTIAQMQLWDNGVRKYTAYNTTHLSKALTLVPAFHKLTVYAINTAGTKWSSSVTVNVQ